MIYKENTLINRWKKFLLSLTDRRTLIHYKDYFDSLVDTSVNARELKNFVVGLLHDISIHKPGDRIPAEYDIQNYSRVVIPTVNYCA